MRSNIFYWGLYDFANSIVMVTFLFYFSQWLVLTEGRPVWWYNATLIISSVLFVTTTPFLSRRIDIDGKKLGGMRLWTLISFVSFSAVAFITLFFHTLDALAMLLDSFAMYAYLVCFVYFTPVLNDLSTAANRSRISSIGQGFNYAGLVAGLLVTLPFANGTLHFVGATGYAQPLLPATLLFGLLALPMLFLYRGPEHDAGRGTTVGELGTPLSILKTIIANKNLLFLLISYFFFSDALLTFSNNYPLYLEKVFGVSDTTKALLSVAILALAAVGAFVFSSISDRHGDRKTLLAILAAYALLFPALAFAPSFAIAVGISLLMGTILAAVFGISRAMVGHLAPSEIVASSFNYYTLAERFATFIGPATWSIVLLSYEQGVFGYRMGILSMGVLVTVGLLVLIKVKEPQAGSALGGPTPK